MNSKKNLKYYVKKYSKYKLMSTYDFLRTRSENKYSESRDLTFWYLLIPDLILKSNIFGIDLPLIHS